KIVFHLVDGPFSSLTGHWAFQPLGGDGCKVLYTMEYTFSSRALSAVVGPVFNRIATSFIDSFTQLAHAVYGGLIEDTSRLCRSHPPVATSVGSARWHDRC